MLSTISWSLYWAMVAIAGLLYYGTIALKYYCFEIKQILSHKSQLSLEVPDQQNVSDTSNKCEEEILVLLKTARDKNLAKEEILYALQLLLNKSSMNYSLDKSNTNNYIRQECLNNCSIHLDEEDLAGLWVN